MGRLASKLQTSGFSVRRFDYRSTASQLGAHACKLAQFSRDTTCETLHFVAHSLGGLVTLHMLNETQGLPAGRVVLLASPLDGNAIARRSRRLPGAGTLLGEVGSVLEQGYGRLPEGRDTGMIAGTRSIGLGMLLGGAGKPGDGTVSVAETRAAGLKDHLLLPVSHTGILYSSEVARQAACFLKTGSFDWPAAC